MPQVIFVDRLWFSGLSRDYPKSFVRWREFLNLRRNVVWGFTQPSQALVQGGDLPMVTLADVMTREVISIDQEASVQLAAEKMRKEKICSLLVQQAGNFIGVVTETDVVKKVVAERKNLSQTKVGAIMTSPIISIESTQPVNKANIIMAAKGFRHLPVSSGGKIVGIVSSKDLASHIQWMKSPAPYEVDCFWRGETMVPETGFGPVLLFRGTGFLDRNE